MLVYQRVSRLYPPTRKAKVAQPLCWLQQCWNSAPWRPNGWLVGGLEHEWIIFPFNIWDVILPNWRTPSFFKRVIAPPTRCENANHSKPFLALQWPMVQLPQLPRAVFLGTWDEMAKSSKKSLNSKWMQVNANECKWFNKKTDLVLR